MNPKYPIYIPTKGRSKSRLTIKFFEKIGLDFFVVIESQEQGDYSELVKKCLILPFSNQGLVATRNWIWGHALDSGTKYFWTFDDNIRSIYRLNGNIKARMATGTALKIIEDFTARYSNLLISGMNYEMFAPRKNKHPPFVLNTRIYSNMLIKTDIPYRNEGFLNDDTDLCLRVLKDGWCTVLFNAFLIDKVTTMTIDGGMTPHYQDDGRYKMALELQRKHPDIVKITRKWGRWQHQVDYSQFKKNKLIRKKNLNIQPGIDNFGMKLVQQKEIKSKTLRNLLGESGKMGILDNPPKLALNEFILRCSKSKDIDCDLINETAVSTIKFLQSNKEHRSKIRLSRKLENRWYESLENGQPDYGVYNTDQYIAELWACWVVYSRQYMLNIQKPKYFPPNGIVADIGKVENVIDLGCGFGFSTAAFREFYPDAEIIGTNLADTIQMKLLRQIAEQYNFKVVSQISKIQKTKIDIIFASEYFEHIYDALDHLEQILSRFSPRVMIIANTFSAKSIGHFPEYKVKNSTLPGKQVSRLFNNILRSNGYEKIKTTLWNNRPTYWRNH